MKKLYLLRSPLSLLLFCMALIIPSQGFSQITVTDAQTAQQLAQKLVGTGVTILNPTLTCASVANGVFAATNSNLGLDSGIVLTSGRAKTQNGFYGVNITNGQTAYVPANPSINFASTGNGTPGDAQLTALAGQGTNDACVLQFDFKPTGDTIKFQYVFGSEEYTNYTCSSFNDVFGFFISGPGYGSPTNIAKVPGTNIPVCINSVNCMIGNPTCAALGPGSPFCAYYTNNQSGTTVMYDGFTHVLTAIAGVTPCDTYHLKLGVADAVDDVLDSGVFIKAGSLSSPGISVTETHNKAIRGCKPGEFVFNVTPPSADTLVVHYQITGTAVNGYDYQTIADSVVFQPFQASDTLMIYPQGVPPTGPKTVELRVYAPYTCNGQQQIIDSVTMTIYDSVKVHILTSDTTVCNGDSVNVIASADSFLIYYNWTPNIGIVYDTVLSPRIGPPLDTAIMYVITALSDSAYGCKSTDSILIRTRTIKIDSVTVTPSSCNACDGTMTVYGLVPGEQDTISLTINGNPLTPVPVVADTNGQAVLTGLCPGIYTNVFANYGLCKSDTLGDTIITVQLAANGMSFTNPTKCGFCDGTITLSNITLSTVDTVTYTIDGVTNAVQGPFNVTAGGSIVLAGLCAGNYSNIVIHSGFCTSVAYGTFTLVNPAIVINSVTTSNPSACGVCDGTIVLNGLPETQFDTTAWQFNGVWQPYIVFPVGMNNDVDIVNLCAGTYDSIVIHTNHGCSITEVGPYTLTGPSVGAGFSYNIHYSCKGTDTVVFQNQSNPIAPIHVRWHFGDNTMDTTANPSHVYDTEGVYQVTQYVSNLNCTDSLTQTVDTRHPIAASFTVNPSDTLCQGSMVTFTNTSVGGNPQYWWHFGDESVTDSIDFNPPGHFYLTAGTYHVLLVERDTLGCIDSAHANIVVDPIGGASITASDTNICAGQQITFHANYTKNGSTSITWDMGDGYSISNLNPVTHAYQGSNLPQSLVVTLNVTNRICPDTSAQQTIHVMPYPAINLGMDTAMCPGSAPITLADQINIGNPLASWHWNTGETTPSITVNQPGLYYSTVTLEGCSNSDSVLVANDCYIAVPNVFTPNGDGVNDYFFPRQFLTSGATNFSMEIYNRWGQQIFSTTNTEGQGWDGKFNGVIQPEGVYIYIIDVTFKDGKHEHHQGNVTLMK